MYAQSGANRGCDVSDTEARFIILATLCERGLRCPELVEYKTKFKTNKKDPTPEEMETIIAEYRDDIDKALGEKVRLKNIGFGSENTAKRYFSTKKQNREVLWDDGKLYVGRLSKYREKIKKQQEKHKDSEIEAANARAREAEARVEQMTGWLVMLGLDELLETLLGRCFGSLGNGEIPDDDDLVYEMGDLPAVSPEELAEMEAALPAHAVCSDCNAWVCRC
jgi:hypothetical protein